MRKRCLATTEEVAFSLYCVDGDYGVIVSTHHGLLETTLPSAVPPDEILENLHKRFVLARGENELTREAAESLLRYFSGEFVGFNYPVDERRFSAFQSLVYHAVQTIGYGLVKTYGEIAREIHRPKAARGVGAAMAHNPCRSLSPVTGLSVHRVP